MELKGAVRCTGVVPYGLYSSIARELCVMEAYIRKIWKLYCTSDSLSPMKRGPVKGFMCKITEEDHEYIKMLVSSDPTIYKSEIRSLLVENSNTINDTSDISLTPLNRTVRSRIASGKIWTRKKTICVNDL